MEYEESEFAWNPVKKGGGGRLVSWILDLILTELSGVNMYLSDHHRDRSQYPKRARRCR